LRADALLSFAAKTPARLLLVVWAAAIALFALGPIRYDEAPRLSTWVFVVACLLAFCIGSWIAGRSSRSAIKEQIAPPIDTARWLDRIVRATALIGLFGALCIAVDKVLLSGLDFSGGVTAVRFARAAAVDAGTAGELRRSPLLYVGYFTFSFSVASYLLYILKGEILRRSTVLLAFMALASIFSYSYLYGGRSPLGLVLGMAVGAIAVRLLSRQSALPKGTLGRILFVAFLALTVVYNNWILAQRFVATGAGNYSDLEQRFETTYDAHIELPAGLASSPPSPSATTIPATAGGQRPSTSDQALMQFAINYYYATHELPMLDRTLTYEGPLGPYYGAYQFYLASVLVGHLTPWTLDATMLPQLKSANVYGWFSTAWGGMYLDFGVFGALVGITLCGWLAGLVYRRALVGSGDAAKLLMCYVVAGIIATPVLSIFTISISLPILGALLITAFFLGPAANVPLRRLSRLTRAGLPNAQHP
jgi:hypothetical protein